MAIDQREWGNSCWRVWCAPVGKLHWSQQLIPIGPPLATNLVSIYLRVLLKCSTKPSVCGWLPDVGNCVTPNRAAVSCRTSKRNSAARSWIILAATPCFHTRSCRHLASLGPSVWDSINLWPFAKIVLKDQSVAICSYLYCTLTQ